MWNTSFTLIPTMLGNIMLDNIVNSTDVLEL